LANAQNHLLELLPRKDRKRLLAVSEAVEFVLAEVLYERDTVVRDVYFPVDGFVSLVTQVDKHPSLEVGMVGREGMLGASLALGIATTPLRAVVQGAGSAWRIAAVPFRLELARSPALKRCLDRYLYVLMAQLAASAAIVTPTRRTPSM
jgi:hypothetical protein